MNEEIKRILDMNERILEHLLGNVKPDPIAYDKCGNPIHDSVEIKEWKSPESGGDVMLEGGKHE
jgi:hypothetical protein